VLQREDIKAEISDYLKSEEKYEKDGSGGAIKSSNKSLSSNSNESFK
jgi:hypothetical protein